ncbi:MAG: hypothetical protein JXB49_31420, partial [Bacteroidales bacterium]|nr:hypothetical protein [Bacteroidales bacterium]
MRKVILLSFISFICFVVTFSQSVLSNAGKSLVASNNEIIFSVGEPIVGINSDILQGFQYTALAYVQKDLTVQPPDTLFAEAGNKQITLFWSSNGISGLSKYKIFRDSVLIDSVEVTVSLDDTVYTDSNLTNYQTYQYYITSVDTFGNESQPSDTIYIAPHENGTFIDARDGQIYNWIKIGSQIWMAENLRAIKYTDDTSIPEVTGDTEWGNLGDNNTDKAYCWYNNDSTNNAGIYGALYTWAAA